MNLTDSIGCVLARRGNPEVWAVDREATVFDALQLMAEKDVGALLALDRGQLCGIISERDYARKVILLGKSSHDTLVEEIMSERTIYATPHSTVDECMHLMTGNRVRHLPVLEGSTIVGIVSIGDLVNWIINSHEETIHQLHAYVSSSYPG